jgi:hypothetical protein
MEREGEKKSGRSRSRKGREGEEEAGRKRRRITVVGG